MKKSNIFALILFIGFIISSIFAVVAYTQTGGIIERNISTEEREVKDFNKVILRGAGELYITQGETNKLTIEASESYLERINTEVENNTLILGEEKQHIIGLNVGVLSTERVLRYNLTVADLSEVKLEGFGSIIIDEMSAEDITISIAGAGEIIVSELKADELTATLDGAGSIEILDGNVTTQTIDVQGLGNYDAKSLKSNFTTANLDGAGSVKVFVSDLLTANLDGLGSIDYWGDAEVKSNIDGLGDIQHHN